MQVFAEYFEENKISLRKTTLLQFGESWELIGSAVLKNPGSADPIKKIDDHVLWKIEQFYPMLQINKNNWYEFIPDKTMGFISKIFNGWYIDKEKSLSGIIQLFNLSCIKDQDLSHAREKLLINNSAIAIQSPKEIIPLFKDKPVYLGWGDEYDHLSDEVKLNTKEIFTFVKNMDSKYLKENFSDNKFYHPQYINISYNSSDSIKDTLTTFYAIINNI